MSELDSGCDERLREVPPRYSKIYLVCDRPFPSRVFFRLCMADGHRRCECDLYDYTVFELRGAESADMCEIRFEK